MQIYGDTGCMKGMRDIGSFSAYGMVAFLKSDDMPGLMKLWGCMPCIAHSHLVVARERREIWELCQVHSRGSRNSRTLHALESANQVRNLQERLRGPLTKGAKQTINVTLCGEGGGRWAEEKLGGRGLLKGHHKGQCHEVGIIKGTVRVAQHGRSGEICVWPPEIGLGVCLHASFHGFYCSCLCVCVHHQSTPGFFSNFVTSWLSFVMTFSLPLWFLQPYTFDVRPGDLSPHPVLADQSIEFLQECHAQLSDISFVGRVIES